MAEFDFHEKPNIYLNLSATSLNDQQQVSIESKISKALKNNEISQEDFATILNEEKKYRELKESIRMMNSQRGDVKNVSLIEEGKKIGINEVIRCNQIIYNSLK